MAAGLINCTGSHVVTQAEMNAGTPITNTAVVSFLTVPAIASQSANVTTAIVQQASLTVTKEADRFTADAAGQVKKKRVFFFFFFFFFFCSYCFSLFVRSSLTRLSSRTRGLLICQIFRLSML